MDFEQYEKECKQIRKENAQLISDFEKWLSEKKLSSKTINKHASKEDLSIVKEHIKVEMPEWLATMDRYDDQNITDTEDVWGL